MRLTWYLHLFRGYVRPCLQAAEADAAAAKLKKDRAEETLADAEAEAGAAGAYTRPRLSST
jgi:hypothetical protein